MITINEVKDYLNQIRYINQEINSRVQERYMLKDAITIKSPSFNDNKVQESGTMYFDDKYMKYIEASEHINRKIDELVDLKMRISHEIDMMENSAHRILLRMRYINLNTFEEIAVEMNYDIRQIHRIHGAALQEFVSLSHCMSG